MSLEDFTVTLFEPSTAELESEPKFRESSDGSVAGQEAHILIGDDKEGKVDVLIEPQLQYKLIQTLREARTQNEPVTMRTQLNHLKINDNI